MKFGPFDDPRWALLDYGTKATICAQQQKMDKRDEKRQRDAAQEEALQRGLQQQPQPPLMLIPPPPPQPVLLAIQPSLTDDRKTLILLPEVRQPQEKRQPEISLSTDAVTKTQQINISGQGIQALSAIGLRCGDAQWSLPLGALSQSPEKNRATFPVSKEIAAKVLESPTCHVALAGALLPIPRDLLSVVWGKTPPSGSAH